MDMASVQDMEAAAGADGHPDSVEPWVVTTWLVILVTCALALWWQSVLYERSLQQKLKQKQEEAIFHAEQQELRKEAAQVAKAERLAREDDAQRRRDARLQVQEQEVKQKEAAMHATAKARVEAVQSVLDERAQREREEASQRETERKARDAAFKASKAAQKEAHKEAHAASAAIMQAEYASSVALKATQEYAEATLRPGTTTPLYSEVDPAARIQAMTRAQAALEQAARDKEVARRLATRARSSVVGGTAGGGNAVINGVGPSGESEADRAVREGTVSVSKERSLKAQQDEEFRQALELDQAREASAAEARRAKQALRQKWDDMDEPDAECADSVDVLIRLPSGQRLRRRFPTSTPIAVLFEFLDVYWEPGKAAKPAKKFDLATSFPKRVFDRQDAEESSTTLADEGIDPQRVFFVQWK